MTYATEFPATRCPVLGPDDWTEFKKTHRNDVIAAMGSLDAADEAMAGEGFSCNGIHIFFDRRKV
jgi:hypothetical protein